ncbi:MAG TPA: asparagine synthase (glutamine-hydrolyzing) [Gemmatimonadales bacterium]|nr:asparagine synthase (glutamine-hydrolyzing) [Gemmatimonadales bacterium]
MCGFAGIAFTRGEAPGPQLLDQMQAAVRHRGPDAEHQWCTPDAAMVHCRLKVIDLSSEADQPFQRSDLDAVIAFNGEIYNYRALGDDLASRGLGLRTHSDTEVLLASLVEEGPEALRRMRGMFALAFWRPQRQTLLLARDPLGKKPLFWARRPDGALVFGSTLQAIVAGLGYTPAVRPDAVAQYLHHLVVPQHTCIYEGVQRVPPGGWIQFEAGAEPKQGRHWAVPDAPTWHGSDRELAQELESHLRASVRRRLVADVPVGAFLSAGKDSGLIVALAAQEHGGRLRTFTAGTAGHADDERAQARLVAERYGTAHTEVEVPPLSASNLPLLLWQAGEPFADASLLPSAAVAAAARADVTVALTGDGGDELFFGYTTFGGMRAAEAVRRGVPAGVLRGLRPLVGDGQGRGWRNKADAVLEYATAGFSNRMGWGRSARTALLAVPETSAPEEHYRVRLARWAGLGSADALRRTLIETRLPDDYLTKVDVATMAVALEARCPFLDVDLVDFLLRIPASVAFRRGRPKALLAPLVRQLLPPSLASRRKTGFGVPLRRWLLGPLRTAYDRFVLQEGRAMHQFVDREAAGRAFRALEAGSARADRVWALFAFGVWAAVAIDCDLAPDEPLPDVQ